MKTTGKLGKRGGLLLLATAVALPAWRTGVCSGGWCSLPAVSGDFVLAAAAMPAQVWNRDPLTEQEANQLRETAAEPDKRMALLAEFATARMAKVDEAKTSKPARARAQKIHDALDEFSRVMDEIDDNIDDYESRKMDMRKGLAKLIEADTIFQAKLAELQSAGDESAAEYRFVLEDSMDVVTGQLKLAQNVLQEQERRAEEEKERKKHQKDPEIRLP